LLGGEDDELADDIEARFREVTGGSGVVHVPDDGSDAGGQSNGACPPIEHGDVMAGGDGRGNARQRDIARATDKEHL
jgi:hypothetical protein